MITGRLESRAFELRGDVFGGKLATPPGPRPSSRSLERNFTWARMPSAEISGTCAHRQSNPHRLNARRQLYFNMTVDIPNLAQIARQAGPIAVIPMEMGVIGLL